MSDFFSGGWSIFIAVATLVGLARLPGAAAVRRARASRHGRRQQHRPRLGRRPARAEQPAAALVDGACSSSRSCSRSVYLLLYPGLGQLPRAARLDQPRRVRRRIRPRPTPNSRPVYAAYARHAGRSAGQRPDGDGHRRAPVHQQLRRLPRLRRARQQGLPEPDRQRLAARRHAREDRGDDHPRPHRRDAADGRRGRHADGRARTSPTTC